MITRGCCGCAEHTKVTKRCLEERRLTWCWGGITPHWLLNLCWINYGFESKLMQELKVNELKLHLLYFSCCMIKRKEQNIKKHLHRSATLNNFLWEAKYHFPILPHWVQTLHHTFGRVTKGFWGIKWIQPCSIFTGVRALNLLPVLHFAVSLNNVIEIIIWKGNFLSRCPRGVFSAN